MPYVAQFPCHRRAEDFPRPAPNPRRSVPTLCCSGSGEISSVPPNSDCQDTNVVTPPPGFKGRRPAKIHRKRMEPDQFGLWEPATKPSEEHRGARALRQPELAIRRRMEASAALSTRHATVPPIPYAVPPLLKNCCQ